MYHETAIEFIRKVMRIRLKLIEVNRSQINNDFAIIKIGFLKRHIDYNGYKNDVTAANFWKRNRVAIITLIPGGNSSSSASLITQFHELDHQAKIITSKTKKHAQSLR